MFLLPLDPLMAASIGELSDTTWTEQALRFLSLRDPAVRLAVLGSLLLGLSCGLLGSFLVVRRLALVGDMLSHAVLPGVILGFLWHMTKDTKAILIGAVTVGLLSTVVMSTIRETTRLKEDSALAMVLAGFYGLGVFLYSILQNHPSGDKSGLDKFMFGQAAALSTADVQVIAVITALALVLILVFYPHFLAMSFDSAFASTLGIPTRAMHYLTMLLLSFTVVAALQAVGVVLVSALLIIPAATAYLLSDRMHSLLIYAALFGVLASLSGAFLSFLSNGLPTGPFMVLSAGALFVMVLVFAPRRGWLPKYLKRLHHTQRIQMENTLKAVFHIREQSQFTQEGIPLSAVAQRSNQSVATAERQARRLAKNGMATLYPSKPNKQTLTGEILLHLTPSGWQRAQEVIRNHRLWELYLTDTAEYPADHVHDDAEVIEHILGDDVVNRLKKQLNYPEYDPHGKRIPE